MRTAEQNLQLLKEIEANRSFLLAAYEQNPQLLKRAEPRIRELLAPRQNESATQPGKSQRGISLIELIIFIVILSVALTGILLVMNQVSKHSADPLIHKQALAVAESLLEEIELQDFVMASGVTATSGAVNAGNRAGGYHIVSDYNGFATTGIFPISGPGISGLENYDASVAVSGVVLDNIGAASAVVITVTVTDPSNETVSVSGYRTAYDGFRE